MAYTKRNIVDRIAVGDDCFRLEKLSDGRYRLIPTPDSVVEAGTNIDRNLLQPMEDAIYDLVNNSEHPVPTPEPEDAGKAIIVQFDGSYGLGETGLTEVSADIVTAGTFAGAVAANEAAQADMSTPMLRNIVKVDTDPGDGAAVDYPVGTRLVYYGENV